ncbi:polyhydroxyalkanoic acid system family protein [Lignipirellula cremea]|uniref:Polyhydroxyalkanoic acid system protein (PHA_gran_rgn) n=1 Tax=Lignipirellula cremea TaxID=2528010 RepID=A0A518DMD1_9BACT|nr:polyhydroxyalkanoic acid system family protein [Lignipirellula cremea]QDU93000.1 Putative polyhydroxyalkanoic acid system protein (PHA_gran_rgn) [Lignipirellula cremea]
MPNMNIVVPNPLGKEAAKTKLKNFLETVRSKYKDQVSNLEETWVDDTLNYSFKTYGFAIKGQLIVEESQVVVNGALPMAAFAFRGKIEQSIKTELEKQLA